MLCYSLEVPYRDASNECLQYTILDLFTAHTSISAQSSNS